MTVLDCEKFVIRPWVQSDLDSLVLHANTEKIASQLRDRFPHPYTREAGRAWLDIATSMDPLTAFALAVNEEAVGGIGIELKEDIARCSAEIGYWLGEEHWGKGIVTKAVIEMTRHAFETFELTRLYALVFEENQASRRVLEKAGYTLDAILQRNTIKAGRIHNQALYSTLRENVISE